MGSRAGGWLLSRARRGDRVVRLRLGGMRLVYLLGPEANDLVFGHDEWFRTREAFAALEIVDGPTSVVLSDGVEHARRRGLIRPVMAPRRIAGYLGTMVASADEALATIGPGESFDAYARFRGAIRCSTLRALFGPQLAARGDEIGDLLEPLLHLTDRLPQTIEWLRRLRMPSWRRAMAARTATDEFIARRIEAERHSPDREAGPMLRLLVHGRDGTGSGMSEDEIRDQAVTMIAAGYSTTSAAMGWAIYLLGAHPEWQDTARAEVAEVLGDRAPGPDDLARLRVLGACLNESLRLYPPAMISARYTVTGFEYAGSQVRPGDMVIVSPYVTHRDPRVFDDPLSFRPQRWLDEPRRPPNEFLPFGGGKHRCLGSGLATTELTVMLARLLARGPFALGGPPTATRSMVAMRPHPYVRIRIQG